MASKRAEQIRARRLKPEAAFENASDLKLVSVVAIALFSVLTALVLKGWFCRIFSFAPWDFGPAYRAIDLRNFILGKPLYSEFRAPPYHDANAYNPLCYYLAAWLVPLFAPNPISSL